MKLHTIRVLGLLLACGLAGRPQTPPAQPGQVAMPAATGASQVGNGSISPNDQLAPLQTVGQHWKLFLNETFGPLSLGGTIFNSLFSQVTNSDPLYGTGATAFGQRVGASAADIAAQNFFGDFLVASVFHEDPRYIRLGEGHSFGRRFGYAISRAFVIRKSSGRNGFNWDNLLGSGPAPFFRTSITHFQAEPETPFLFTWAPTSPITDLSISRPSSGLTSSAISSDGIDAERNAIEVQ